MSNETRDEMLERHKRELAELDLKNANWWKTYFTESPSESFERFTLKENWLKWFDQVLPTIIRKREKLGVIICRFSGPVCDIYRAHTPYEGDVTIPDWLADRLVGRPLAPGEKVEL